MVRNLVGALVKVGEGKITAADFLELMEEKERTAIQMPAPAQGLYLMKVKY
jgi:tRNA pseudouridine38-40 synthase